MQHKASPASRGGADLGNDSIGKLLFKLALPAIVAQLINVLYNMVDRMYIGHLPEIGETALTGVGVCFPLITAISAFAALVSMGGAPRASIFLGKGDKETAERILGNCATALVVVGLVLTAVFYLFGYRLLQLFGASPETIGYSWEYFRLYLVGTIFVQASLGLNAFINAQGYALVGMLTVIIGAVLNIILDPVLCSGWAWGCRAPHWRPSCPRRYLRYSPSGFCAANIPICGSRSKICGRWPRPWSPAWCWAFLPSSCS